MFDKRNARVVVVVAAVGIVVGIVATLSFSLYSPPADSTVSKEECARENNCAIISVNGSQYMLKGEGYRALQDCTAGYCAQVTVNSTYYLLRGDAYKAYQDFENFDAQLHMMKFESQFLEEREEYLILIEGYDSGVDRLVEEYSINVTGSKTGPLTDAQNTPTGIIHKDAYGLIYKTDLIRLVEENDADSLKAQSIQSIGRVGSYSVEAGTEVHNPFSPTPEESQLIGAENMAFVEAETLRIVTEKTGVTRISDQDFFSVD